MSKWCLNIFNIKIHFNIEVKYFKTFVGYLTSLRIIVKNYPSFDRGLNYNLIVLKFVVTVLKPMILSKQRSNNSKLNLLC